MLNELVLYVVIYVYLLIIFVFILLLMKVIYNLIKKFSLCMIINVFFEFFKIVYLFGE